MMSDKTKKVYSEVYAFLNIVSEEDRNKIPKKLKEMIEEEREKEYTPSYTFEIPIEEQEISDEAIAMIALLHLNYWCEDENEKERLNAILDDNEKKYQEELREKYNTDNLFKDKKYREEQSTEEQTNNVAMVEYKETIFSKLKEWFRNLFNKKRLKRENK